ncbi:LysR family transcriptional regulator [Bordetella genomosp. 8]|uniref:LysR family transcriptional regulator n=1 Tax=Bordetella genomosp. 8 TaxID=1416806 RepID=A0A1W6YTX7_9BORD|nr:LysR family transcriptional regulator [Bordetella genomosp. 8]ARP84545.1 LysR family transcriptional regulator [Bordetella genomosp. 8]
MDYSLRDLKFFETVAELGNIGRAADMLGRSQPAITKCIQRLEESIGGELFVRAGRGITLTPVGELLLFRSRQLTSKAAEIDRELSDFAQGNGGHVRIGSGLVSADQIVPDLCAKILAGSVRTTFEIVVDSNIPLREDLRNGSIDLLLGLLPTADPDFTSVAIAEEVVVAVAPSSHPVFAEADPTLETLLQHPWALPSEKLPSRQWLDAAFTSRGFRRPTVLLETNAPALLPRVVSDAGLIGFLPRRVLRREHALDLREIPIGETTFSRQFGVSYRRAGLLSPAARRIVDILVSVGPAILADV